MTKESGIKIEYGHEMLHRDNWNLEILTDLKFKQSLMEKMAAQNNGQGDLVEALNLSMQKEVRLEDDHMVYDRAQIAKKYLINQMPKLFTGENKNKKVLIFGHGIFFYAFTAESKRDGRSLFGTSFNNKLELCETETSPCFIDEFGKFEFSNSTKTKNEV